MAPSRRIRVFVVDEHPLFLESLARAVSASPGMELVGAASRTEPALADIRGLEPDVAVADAGPGARLLDALRREGLGTKLVLLAETLEDRRVYDALAAGAWGYLSKEMDETAILAAVVAAADARIDLPAEVQTRLVLELRRRQELSRPALTPRELSLLGLLAEGCTTAQIAARGRIAEATAKAHLRTLYDKLGVGDRTAAVAVAIRRGLL